MRDDGFIDLPTQRGHSVRVCSDRDDSCHPADYDPGADVSAPPIPPWPREAVALLEACCELRASTHAMNDAAQYLRRVVLFLVVLIAVQLAADTLFLVSVLKGHLP